MDIYQRRALEAYITENKSVHSWVDLWAHVAWYCKRNPLPDPLPQESMSFQIDPEDWEVLKAERKRTKLKLVELALRVLP